MKNPFNPTFGDVPKLFLKSNTDSEVKHILKMITESDFARSIFITGVRGVGKTSLMMRISEDLSANKDFYIVDLINREGILSSLLRLLSNQVNSKLQQTLKSINGTSIGNFLSVEREKEAPNVDVLLDELMQGIKKEGKKVLITVDEVTNSKPIRDLIQTFSSFKRKKYPVYLLMTGLPDLILNLQNDEKLTFLLRSDKIVVSPLQKLDIFNTYKRIFNCDNIVATKLTNMTQGYSYAFQLLGYLLYDHMDGKVPTEEDIKAITENYKNTLFNNAYQKIFTEMSSMDQEYLYAVCGNHKLSEVSKIMHKSNVFVAQYRRRAIERNLIVPSKMGYVKFTLPFFEDYLDETKDVDSIFYLGFE
ncbi:ATP-binding protein [Lactobacillus helveticus]|uniref:ATP-binding protein n=1 Tax=Lactobacillus helveticus TaxID=1587 RepID=UPI0030CC60DE